MDMSPSPGSHNMEMSGQISIIKEGGGVHVVLIRGIPPHPQKERLVDAKCVLAVPLNLLHRLILMKRIRQLRMVGELNLLILGTDKPSKGRGINDQLA